MVFLFQVAHAGGILVLVLDRPDQDGTIFDFIIKGIWKLFQQCSPERTQTNRKNLWMMPNQLDDIVDALEEFQSKRIGLGFVVAGGVQNVAFSL